MSLPRLYVETTIPSYLTARPSRDTVLAGQQEATRRWWEEKRGNYDLYAERKALEESDAVRDLESAELEAQRVDRDAKLDVLAALLRQFIDQIVSGPGRRGCFLGHCAAELPRSDRVALARVRQGLESIEATFRDALARAKARGELSPVADVDALARFLTAGFQGLRLIGKVNPNRDVLEDIAATILQCLETQLAAGRR